MFWSIFKEVSWANRSAEWKYIEGRNDELEYSLERDEILIIYQLEVILLLWTL